MTVFALHSGEITIILGIEAAGRGDGYDVEGRA
jgi:hypothetical protein